MKKLIKLLKRRRKNSGFTLVEMVISCGLLGILVVGITLFISPVLQSAASNEVNVRATLLADTVNNYISRTTRGSYYVKVFTGTDKEAAGDKGTIKDDEDIQAMLKFVKDSVDKKTGKSPFELKCISFSWSNDPNTQQNKFMVMNETFKENTAVLSDKPIAVFEDCFYEDLFPQFTVEEVKGKDVAPGSDEDEDTVPALKITTTVYNDEKMASAEFIGVGYTEYGVIKNKTLNSDGTYKFFGVKPLNKTDEEGKPDPHATTFIYYVTRRSFASEALPGSSSSSSSSSSSTT